MGKASNRWRATLVRLKNRVFSSNRRVGWSVFHSRCVSYVSARIKFHAFEWAFEVASAFASVHIGVGLDSVAARAFVRVETGLVARIEDHVLDALAVQRVGL